MHQSPRTLGAAKLRKQPETLREMATANGCNVSTAGAESEILREAE
jgi:hypothetical protein